MYVKHIGFIIKQKELSNIACIPVRAGIWFSFKKMIKYENNTNLLYRRTCVNQTDSSIPIFESHFRHMSNNILCFYDDTNQCWLLSISVDCRVYLLLGWYYYISSIWMDIFVAVVTVVPLRVSVARLRPKIAYRADRSVFTAKEFIDAGQMN